MAINQPQTRIWDAATGNFAGVSANGLKTDGSAVTQPVSATSLPLPAGAATETTLGLVNGKLPASLGQKAMAASLAVVLASDQAAIPVTVAASSTATLASVASSITTVVGVASNVSRKGLVMVNDGTANCFLAFGAAASTTAFTYKLSPGSTFEMGSLYTGAINAIWDVANGSLRVTDLS